MKALTFHAPFQVRFEEVPEPTLLDPRDALVEVELGAICGSDLHVYRGHETGLDRGTVLGHEFLGTVVEVGPEVRRFRPEDRVVSPFSTSCGSCFFCGSGLTSRCEKSQLFGWVQGGAGLHGAQAELVRVPLADSTLVSVPPALALEEALLAGDVLSTGYSCAETSGIGPGDVVAVLGCGPIGLAGLIAARDLGAARVFALDYLPERLELAERFGAEPLPHGDEDPLARVRAATGGRGADVVLEMVGSPQASRLAIDLVRTGGAISAAGVHTEERFAFSPGEAYLKNLTYRAGRAPARAYMDRMLDWISSHPGELSALISHRLPLSEGVRGYEVFEKKLEGCTKILLVP